MILCYITDRKTLPTTRSLLWVIQNVAAAGVDWIQIREKDLTGRDLAAWVRAAVAAAPRTRILVNDRLDAALAAGAAGVHLGRESLPAGEVVPWCRAGNAPAGFKVGVSCHSLAEVQQAERDLADYALFGPVYSTPSKMVFGAPQRVERLAEVCRTVSIPVLAVGGITPQNAAECLRAGAAGLAAIRAFQDATDIAVVTQAFRRL
jgi:thiamine-phosphate pyrophosphorylase